MTRAPVRLTRPVPGQFRLTIEDATARIEKNDGGSSVESMGTVHIYLKTSEVQALAEAVLAHANVAAEVS